MNILSDRSSAWLQWLPLSEITRYYLGQLLATALADRALPPYPGPGQSPDSTIAMTLSLEQLTLDHQNLKSQGATHSTALRQTETEIFRILGLSRGVPSLPATVLVVDDTPEILQFLTEILTQRGYEVCSALNGSIALNHAAAIQPDLILLDVMMPGLDGYEVCERLKSTPTTQAIPIIFVTALSDAWDQVKAFNLGGSDYVTKPLQVEQLLVRIEHQLKLHRSTPQIQPLPPDLAYRQFFDRSLDGFYQSDLGGRCLCANPALARLVGYTEIPDVVATLNIDLPGRYLSSTRWRELLTYLEQYRSVQNFISQIRRVDGSSVWIAESLQLVMDDQGCPRHYEGTVRPLPDRA